MAWKAMAEIDRETLVVGGWVGGGNGCDGWEGDGGKAAAVAWGKGERGERGRGRARERGRESEGRDARGKHKERTKEGGGGKTPERFRRGHVAEDWRGSR